MWAVECNRHSVCSLKRFVKERRPSISPNFNFLGQLQHFQSTLSLKASGGHILNQQLDNCLPSINAIVNKTQTGHNMNYQTDMATSDSAEAQQACRDNLYQTDKNLQRHLLSDGSGNQQLSLPGKLRTLHLTLSQNQQHLKMPCKVSAPSPCEPIRPAAKPKQLQLPAGSSSLLEKRKSLTLSLTPLGICPPSPASSSPQARGVNTSKPVLNRQVGERPEGKSQSKACSYRRVEDVHREQNPSQSKCSRTEVKEEGMLSPLSFALSRLLGWGERMLLGGVFVHPVRMGQPALPYSC